MKLICVLLTTFALGASAAYAKNPPYNMKIIPHCEMRDVGDEIICDYSFEQWKLVLKADVELFHLRIRLKKELLRSDELALQVTSLQSQVTAHDDAKSILVKRNESLVKAGIALDKKYQDERVKPRWGNPLAWTIAAVSTALLVGYIANDKL